ncbi:hypothetical protein LEMLEM_LOCUS6856, partial [Lemmus lemmus]
MNTIPTMLPDVTIAFSCEKLGLLFLLYLKNKDRGT